MSSHSRLQKNAHEPSDRLVASIQQRPFSDPHYDQPQSTKHDFSHVDLFAHAPVRGPVQAKLAIEQPGDKSGQVANCKAAEGVEHINNPSVQRMDDRQAEQVFVSQHDTAGMLQRLRHTEDEVRAAITADTVGTDAEKALIRTNGLSYDKHNDNWIYFKANVTQEDGVNTWEDNPRFWYRAMTPVEYANLVSSGTVPDGEHYGGVGPNRNYSAGYMGNASSASHLVEYDVPGIANELLQYVQPKAEGGGTWGLGDTGTGMKGLSNKQQNQLKIDYPEDSQKRLDEVNNAWQTKNPGRKRKTALSASEKLLALPRAVDIFRAKMTGYRLVNLRIVNRL